MFNLYPFFIAFSIIAVAELGDKTQLLTLGFAARYPIWKVIAGVFCATAFLMAAAVFFGEAINYYIPTFYVQLFAGVLFILFGIWNLYGEEENEGEGKRKNKSPFWVVFSGLLLAELGDKTQLATLALSAKYGAPIQVWLGATLGMTAVNSLGAFAGKWIKNFVPEAGIRLIGSAVFIIFGLVTLAGLFFGGGS